LVEESFDHLVAVGTKKFGATEAEHLIACQLQPSVLGNHSAVLVGAGHLSFGVVMLPVDFDNYATLIAEQEQEVHSLTLKRGTCGGGVTQPLVMRVVMQVDLGDESGNVEGRAVAMG